jgi:signal transduction histidine kinase
LTLREQAELAAQTKMRFLADISHELRTPLNSIVGYVDLLSEQIHGPVNPAQHEDLERIRRNQEQLLRVVDELLVFVRAGAPRLNQIVELPAHENMANAVGLIENSMTERSIRYEHDEPDPSVIVLGDAERLRQILLNLLSNAVKFTARGGKITTRCEALGDEVRISVLDSGIGIAESKLESIFEPFIQVEPSQHPDGGVGLGLAISRDLARGMRGDLTVDSKLGRGTCFTLTLPRGRRAAE